jgi:tetratricopeptide (TPR) repeat protein
MTPHILLRFLACAVLLYCILVAARGFEAHRRGRVLTADTLNQAIRWDPQNPDYYIALAQLQEFSLDTGPTDTVWLYQQALRWGPDRAQTWAHLAAAYEATAQEGAALEAYRRAVELFPNSPAISWSFANFELRTGHIDEALPLLKTVLVANPGMRQPVFALAWNVTSDGVKILDQVIPSEPDAMSLYLNVLVSMGRGDEADRVWPQLLGLRCSFPPQAVSPYLDSLINRKKVEDFTAAWQSLLDLNPGLARENGQEGNLVFNGNFIGEPLNGGRDWRISPTEGAQVSFDADAYQSAGRALRILFDGQHNVDYINVIQYVPVMPGRKYRLTADIRVDGITTESGPRLQIIDPYRSEKYSAMGENHVGTKQWQEDAVDFQAGPDTRLIIVRVLRPPSKMLDNRLAGTLWLGSLRLSQLQ